MMGAMTTVELADLLGLTVHGVYKILNSRNLECHINGRKRMLPPQTVRAILEERGFTYQHKTLSFQIVKGGTGKTTLSLALATRSSEYGARVLAIDLDQQGNFSRGLGLSDRKHHVWLDIATKSVSAEDAIVQVHPFLHVIPSNLNNSRLDLELTHDRALNPGTHIKNLLGPLANNYDLIVIDCPPALNAVTTIATGASDLIIIPVNPETFAMDGLHFTLQELEQLKRGRGFQFQPRVILNRYDSRSRLGVIVMHELAQEHADIFLPVIIRETSGAKNAVASGHFFSSLPAKSYIREDTDQMTRELLGLNAWQEALKGAA